MTRFAFLLLSLSVLTACVMPPDDAGDGSAVTGMVRLADTIRARGDLVGAADFYNRAMQRDPESIAARKGLAGVMEQVGDLNGAAAQYAEAVKIKPRDEELWRAYGRTLVSLNRPSEARDAYKTALDIDSNDTKALNGLAVTLDQLGDHEGAQKQFELALEQDPENLATKNNLAYSYIQTGKYQEAIKLLEDKIKQPGATSALRQNLALAYGLAGMDADAERVARMDLSPAQVKNNLDFYKRRRAELAVSTMPYAEIGAYATEAMAAAEIEKIQPHLNRSDADIRPVITPQVTTPGGTPKFAVKMLGCAKPEEVKDLCEELRKMNIPCVAHEGGR